MFGLMAKRAAVFFLAAVSLPNSAVGDDQEAPRQRRLARNTLVAGNLVRDGSWFTLSSRQLAATEKLTHSRPREKTPPGVEVQPPPRPNTIILWRASKNGLAESEVIEFDDLVHIFYLPKRKENPYLILDDSQSQTVLRKLLTQIEKRQEKPIAHEGSVGELKSEGYPKAFPGLAK